LLLIFVSLSEVLGLVASFPTSPSSLKIEFICIFYCIFKFGGFIGSSLSEVYTSPYLIFYLLLLLGFMVTIGYIFFLAFQKTQVY
jgi:hypothetical protein